MNRWQPSKKQKRIFAEKMENDPEFRTAYYARKEKRAEKRRSSSSYDYSSAGGYYVPTATQNSIAWGIVRDDNASKEQKNAAEIVMAAFNGNNTIHHDFIHIVNEYLREKIRFK